MASAAQIKKTARILIQEYCDWHKETYGFPYIPNFTRHEPKMIILVENIGAKEVSDLIKEYWKRRGGNTSLDHFFNTYDTLIRNMELEKRDRDHVDRLKDATQQRVEEAIRNANREFN